MNHNIQHIQERLQQRDFTFTDSQLVAIAEKYQNDTALILGKRESMEGKQYGRDVIILIIRNKQPVTIMTRRETQNFDKRNFSVSLVTYFNGL